MDPSLCALTTLLFLLFLLLPMLQGQGRAVTCLDIDPSGSRLLTGSLDYTVRMFDFSGMKSDLRSFRYEPECAYIECSLHVCVSGAEGVGAGLQLRANSFSLRLVIACCKVQLYLHHAAHDSAGHTRMDSAMPLLSLALC